MRDRIEQVLGQVSASEWQDNRERTHHLPGFLMFELKKLWVKCEKCWKKIYPVKIWSCYREGELTCICEECLYGKDKDIQGNFRRTEDGKSQNDGAENRTPA